MDSKNIFVWSPFTSKVGTINNVINSSYSLIKFSKLKNFNVKLINVFGEWNDLSSEIEKKNIKTIELNSVKFINQWNKEGYIKSRFSYIMIFIFSFLPLLKLIKKEKPNYLIAHLITSLPLMIVTFFNCKTNLILSIAGHPKINLFRKFIWKLSSKKIFKIICPSVELKKILISHNIFDENKIVVIQDPHLMIKKINRLKNEKLEDTFLKNSKILISIGRLTKQKNYIFLIRNFKKLSLKYDDIKLLIIGDGEKKKILQNLIIKFQLENKVKLIGYEKNIYKYLKKSNFYISTSKWEGSSLAMIDAAFMGLPILCSNCPTGRKEFINNDERGFLFDEGDSENFLNKFNEMYKINPDQLKIRLVKAKKESKKFTLLNYFLGLSNIIKN
jgi:glycosyltransferase involved in cell wall biosynthesis